MTWVVLDAHVEPFWAEYEPILRNHSLKIADICTILSVHVFSVADVNCKDSRLLQWLSCARAISSTALQCQLADPLIIVLIL
ncbi:unnamed protein product [Angiostrongylus costaricensis]|uniref:PINc domain-containing protein n=1 Tax=Angiostrongylus costaricensis TaxID=334426 RepID=A0A0R3PXY4_ANGCS|nr:unnamed protein product [Angiostrongylus costaricensis]